MDSPRRNTRGTTLARRLPVRNGAGPSTWLRTSRVTIPAGSQSEGSVSTAKLSYVYYCVKSRMHIFCKKITEGEAEAPGYREFPRMLAGGVESQFENVSSL